jgi:TPR repeat protein
MVALGQLCESGQGTARDPVQAAAWYRKAADLGQAVAMVNLGFLYDKGQGVSADLTQAVTWYRKAADLGNVTAMLNLSVMENRGRGVPRNVVEAYKWLILAAARSSGADQKTYAEQRDEFGATMDPAEVAQAQQLAAAWLAAFNLRSRK